MMVVVMTRVVVRGTVVMVREGGKGREIRVKTSADITMTMRYSTRGRTRAILRGDILLFLSQHHRTCRTEI